MPDPPDRKKEMDTRQSSNALLAYPYNIKERPPPRQQHPHRGAAKRWHKLFFKAPSQPRAAKAPLSVPKLGRRGLEVGRIIEKEQLQGLLSAQNAGRENRALHTWKVHLRSLDWQKRLSVVPKVDAPAQPLALVPAFVSTTRPVDYPSLPAALNETEHQQTFALRWRRHCHLQLIGPSIIHARCLQ